MSKSDNKIRFSIYAIVLVPFIILLVTGVVMLKYHTGAAPESTVIGLDGKAWISFHKLIAFITTPLILLHLFVKTDWVKHFFTFKLKGVFKLSNIALFIIFLLCVFTGFGSKFISPKLGGIHNKFGLLLFILFLIHIWNYRKVIINQFKNLKPSPVFLKKETIKIR